METESRASNKEIMIRLAKLQADMNYVKEYIEDVTLTEEDLESIEEAETEFKGRKTTSHEKLKKEIDNNAD